MTRPHKKSDDAKYCTDKGELTAPDCISLLGFNLASEYIHVRCYGEDVESTEALFCDEDIVDKEVLESIEYEKGHITSYPHLDGEKIYLTTRSFYRTKKEDGGTKVWRVSDSSAVGGSSETFVIKDGEVKEVKEETQTIV
jgi:hypothetical protein